jgi:pre-mRNA-splicing factor RBM22/SLT11
MSGAVPRAKVGTAHVQSESSEFPIACESCLGDTKYLRMMKEPFGRACKLCQRPFTVFRWNSGKDGRMTKTQICQTCSKLKNLCQCCVLDLDHGLAEHVVRSAREEQGLIDYSQSDNLNETNREYFAQQHERLVNDEGYKRPEPLDPATIQRVSQKLKAERQARSKVAGKPYAPRPRGPKICYAFQKGSCARGTSCPYAHTAASSETAKSE